MYVILQDTKQQKQKMEATNKETRITTGIIVTGISYQMLADYVEMNQDQVFEDVYYVQGLRPAGYCIMTASDPKSGELKKSNFAHFLNWVDENISDQGKANFSFQIIA